jgi:hypothetical protein
VVSLAGDIFKLKEVLILATILSIGCNRLSEEDFFQ